MTANDDIIAKHRVQYKSVDCVVFEPETATKIIINFTGMQLGNFNRWSWFYKNHTSGDSALYIVFKDDEHLYYLNRERSLVSDDHVEFIKSMIKRHNLTSKNVYLMGSSMGAFAAIRFAFLLNANKAIASVPQVDFESAKLITPYTLWTRKMLELGTHWVDLDVFVRRSDGTPEVLLLHGTHPADLSAANKIATVFEEKAIVFERIEFDTTDHKDFLTLQHFNDLFTTR